MSGFYRDVKGRAWHYACALQAGWRVLKQEKEDDVILKKFEPQLPFMVIRIESDDDLAAVKRFAGQEGGYPDVFKVVAANYDPETRSSCLPTGTTHKIVNYFTANDGKGHGPGTWQKFLKARCRSYWRDDTEKLVLATGWPEQERFWLAYFPKHEQGSLL